MSVVTTVSAAPHRVIAMLQLLGSRTEPWRRTDLLGVFAPPALQAKRPDADPEDSDYDRGLIRELGTLGLVETRGAGLVALSSVGRVALEDPLRWFRTTLTSPSVAAAVGQGEVPPAIAWLLGRDPLSGLAWQGNYKDEVIAEFGRDLDLSNLTKAQQLFHWARYLGFCWVSSHGNSRQIVYPDPTMAVESLIREGDLPRGRDIPMAEFLKWLGSTCPVLDSAGDELVAAPQATEAGQSSLRASLGVALEQLALDGLLSFDNKSDAKTVLLGPPGTTRRVATHIKILGGPS